MEKLVIHVGLHKNQAATPGAKKIKSQSFAALPLEVSPIYKLAALKNMFTAQSKKWRVKIVNMPCSF